MSLKNELIKHGNWHFRRCVCSKYFWIWYCLADPFDNVIFNFYNSWHS